MVRAGRADNLITASPGKADNLITASHRARVRRKEQYLWGSTHTVFTGEGLQLQHVQTSGVVLLVFFFFVSWYLADYH